MLTYHSIAATTTPTFARLTVEPSLFAEHVVALTGCGLPLIPFAEVPAALAEGRDAVCITVDDGLVDAAENACPVLAARAAPATFFVPSGYLGLRAGWLRGADGQRPVLSPAEVAGLSRAGFEVGAHGRMHIAADINDPGVVFADAMRCRRELEECIDAPVRSFAYPFGFHSASGRSAVRQAGFAQACVVGDLHARPQDDRWTIPRLQVWSDTTAEQVVEIVSQRPSMAVRAAIRAKQAVWRGGRRRLAWGPPEAGRHPSAGQQV